MVKSVRGDLFSLPAVGVIVQARPGALSRVVAFIQDNDIISEYMKAGWHGPLLEKIESSTLDRLLPYTSRSVMPSFNYATGVLGRRDVEDLLQMSDVENVWQDRQRSILAIPPEGQFSIPGKKGPVRFTSTEWTRKLVGADVANAKGYDGRGVKVVIVDTGGTSFHPQTRHLIKKSAMMIHHLDENGHGEWVASCIGGARAQDYTNSQIARKEIFCEGMAPGCTLEEIKSLGYVIGTGSDSSLLNGLQMALNDGADVVSNSWGSDATTNSPEEDVYYEPYKVMAGKGIVLVTAAGNSGPDQETINSPGALPYALTVGSYNPVDNTYGPAEEISTFSSRGPTPWGDIKPDCIAPGAMIDSGITGILDVEADRTRNGYSPISGTSMATPHVSGLVALAKQLYREKVGKLLTQFEIMEMLRGLGEPKTSDRGYGKITWSMFETWVREQYKVEI